MSKRKAPPEGFLFDVGTPIRQRPTEAELYAAMQDGAKSAVARWHRGRPPAGGDFDDLRAAILDAAWPRIQKFQFGGTKTLEEYAYMSCYFALRDIQRENIKLLNQRRADTTQDFLPLFERAS